MTTRRRYYVNTVSRDHVQRGVAAGFTQANHGRPAGLKRLTRGDLIVFYSPKTAFEGEAPIRPLIDALGFLIDKQLWGMPFRRGLFEIPASDFRLIARAMKAKL